MSTGSSLAHCPLVHQQLLLLWGWEQDVPEDKDLVPQHGAKHQ